MMDTTAQPYSETIDCIHRDSEGDHEHDRDIECDYRWMCAVCWRVLENGPCPDCAPPLPPGMVRLECTASPPHSVFTYAHDGYPEPCWPCVYGDLSEIHGRCGHARHGAWRSWELTRRIDRLGARIGLWGGFGCWIMNCGGSGASCRTRWRWNGRYWFLGVPKHTWMRWGHLLRHAHQWGSSCGPCSDVCARCEPCPVEECPVSKAAAR
jgi:hypothetical protein